LKAKIEIEIDVDGLTDDELKSLLAEKLYNICFEWVSFDTPPVIQFTDGIRNKKDKSFFKFNWNEREQ
jgi:hypothetical protein